MRGVKKVEVNRRQSEAVVTRIKGQAPGSKLVAAVRRAGYTAKVIPTYRLTLECPTMAKAGCNERMKRALRSVRGVRGIGFPSPTQAVIYFDGRRTSAQELKRLFKSRGHDCSKQG